MNPLEHKAARQALIDRYHFLTGHKWVESQQDSRLQLGHNVHEELLDYLNTHYVFDPAQSPTDLQLRAQGLLDKFYEGFPALQRYTRATSGRVQVEKPNYTFGIDYARPGSERTTFLLRGLKGIGPREYYMHKASTTESFYRSLYRDAYENLKEVSSVSEEANAKEESHHTESNSQGPPSYLEGEGSP